MKIVNFNLGQQTDFLTEQEASTLFDSAGTANNAIASHLSAQNPHQITPTLIGAASTSHTHTGAQITGNISGNAANVTGVIAIANGGTNATNAPTARTNLGITPANIGAAAAIHAHSAFDITSGALPVSRGGTGSETAHNAIEALGAAAKNHSHKEFPIGPEFYSGWGQYGAPYTANYTKIDKLIVLCGLVKRTSGNEISIMLLNSVSRPSERKLFMCWGSISGAYTAMRVDVNTDGVVFIVHPSLSGVSLDWVSLDGIAFCIA